MAKLLSCFFCVWKLRCRVCSVLSQHPTSWLIIIFKLMFFQCKLLNFCKLKIILMLVLKKKKSCPRILKLFNVIFFTLSDSQMYLLLISRQLIFSSSPLLYYWKQWLHEVNLSSWMDKEADSLPGGRWFESRTCDNFTHVYLRFSNLHQS